MKTAILGGGLTGLTLGYLLSKKGVDFEILEKEEECGGLMKTLQTAGFSFDYGGSHIIFSKNQEAMDFLLNLLAENKVKNRRNTKVLYKGCYIKYPFENGLADLPKEDNYECLYGFIQNLISKQKSPLVKPVNLKEWFLSTFGKGIAEKYLIPYNEKIWKYPVEEMGLNWVERIPAPPVEDIIKSSLGLQTEGYTHQLHFYYPKNGGIEALIAALENEIKSKIVKSFDVKSLRVENGKWVVSNGKVEKSFEKVISTIPIHKLVQATDAPSKVKDAVKELKYNSLVTVMIGLERDRINDLSWLYIPDKSSLSHRVSFPSNYSPCVAPKGNSSVLAEITCNMNDKIWKLSDKELEERVVDDLDRLQIINKEQVRFLKVKRLQYAYVISDLNYDRNLATVRGYFDEKGIQLLGRFAEFKYYNMDDCVKRVLGYVGSLH